MAKDIEIPGDLLALQRVANAAHREAVRQGYSPEGWRPWLDAAQRVRQAVTEHAAAATVSRYELEMAVKKAAREADEAENA
ncbi:hypothetical protein ACIOEX_01815 [Streptomyces sp. NPDC087850]|uniref:hypothetical protein n=1 Tax=Streptomyces sp. NPDC087850 TaxID=3365809 RepID=UPI0037F1C158